MSIVVHDKSSDLPIGWGPGFARGPEECAPEYASLWDGLIGAWVPMLGKTGNMLYDASNENNDGTLTNMDPETDWAMLENGYELKFDGETKYISCGKEDSISNLTNLTISTYVKINVRKNQVIVGKHDGSTSGSYYLGTINDEIRGMIITNASGRVDEDEAVPVAFYNTGYHHVAMVYNGANIQLYYDGRPLGTPGSQTGAIKYYDTELRIGRYGSSTVHDWVLNGSIKSVKMYSRALSAYEIKQLHDDYLGMFRPSTKHVFSVTVTAAPTPTPQSIVVHELSSDFPIGWGPGFARGPEECAPEYAGLWDGLVGLWCPELGKTEGELMDVSGYRNHGSIVNGPIWEESGQRPIITFDGDDDHISISKPVTTVVNNFSLFIRCKINEYVSEDVMFYVGTDSGGYGIAQNTTAGENRIAALFGGVVWHYSSFIDDGLWHNWMLIRKSGTSAIYRDGIRDSSSFTDDPHAPILCTSIGAEFVPNGLSLFRWSNISTAAAGVWDRALSDSEINLLSGQDYLEMLTPSIKHIWNVSSTSSSGIIFRNMTLRNVTVGGTTWARP